MVWLLQFFFHIAYVVLLIHNVSPGLAKLLLHLLSLGPKFFMTFDYFSAELKLIFHFLILWTFFVELVDLKVYLLELAFVRDRHFSNLSFEGFNEIVLAIRCIRNSNNPLLLRSAYIFMEHIIIMLKLPRLFLEFLRNWF